jgi:hypothetical protein
MYALWTELNKRFGGPATILVHGFDDEDGFLSRVIGEINTRGSYGVGDLYQTSSSSGDPDGKARHPIGHERFSGQPSRDQHAWEFEQAERQRQRERQADEEWY